MTDIMLFSFVLFTSSIVSGMTGLGGGILLLAFMATIFPPSVLIPLHGIIQVFSNTSRVVISFRNVNYRIFILFAIGAAAGALLGAPLTLSIPENLSTIIIALAIVIFTWFPKILKTVEFKGKFLIVGAVASFLALFIGATGPLTAPFFLNSELNKSSFVPTKAACQIPIHLFKVIVYLFSGFIISKWLPEIIISIPLVFAGNFVGKVIVGKLNDSIYNKTIKLVITFLAVRMVLKLII